jgi:hypothetical protein
MGDVENSYRRSAEDAAWVAIVQVPPHSRQRQNVVTVIVFASVSMILPVQKGHRVGRLTAPLKGDSDILAVLPESPPMPHVGRGGMSVSMRVRGRRLRFQTLRVGRSYCGHSTPPVCSLVNSALDGLMLRSSVSIRTASADA